MAETKCDDNRSVVILAAIEEGSSDRAAAALGGISPGTFYDWLRRGKAGEEPFATFELLARAAKARREQQRVKVIEDASKTDWRAAAWLLERSYTRNWQPPTVRTDQKVDQRINGKSDLRIRVEYVGDDGPRDTSDDAGAIAQAEQWRDLPELPAPASAEDDPRHEPHNGER